MMRALRNVRQRLAEGSILLDKFIITKQLTKQPEAYPDARAQPHVQVCLYVSVCVCDDSCTLLWEC